MLKTFLEKAANDQSVYITDVREAFQAQGVRPPLPPPLLLRHRYRR